VALLERLEIVIEADARTAEREFDRIGKQATESLGSIEDAAGKVGDNAAEQLAGASSKFTQAGRELSDAAGRGLEDMSAAAREAAAALPRAVEDQRQEAEQAGRRVGKQAGEGVADGVRSSGQQVKGAGAAIGADVGDGVSGGLLSGLGDIGGDLGGVFDDALSSLPPGLAGPAAAAGAAAGAAFVFGITDAINTANLGDVIAARVGEGAEKSAEFARVTSDVFAQAWGQSKDEVADAVDAVYSTLEESRGSEEALANLTARAQALGDVFQVDVGEAVAGVGVLLKNGLAKDAEQAFDQITAGLQAVPAAMRDDLLAVFSEGEYVQAFETLGFTGEQAFGLIVEGAKEGSFQLDKIGDSVTEFTRLNQVMSDATREAYDIIGLSAEDMQAKILEGGPGARDAFLQIIEALQAVPDPADRARAAVGLFGTPLSDIANDGEQLNAILDAMSTKSLPGVTGASDDLVNSLDNAKVTLTEVRREFQNGLGEAAAGFFDPVLTMMSGEQGWSDVGMAALNSFEQAFETLPVARLAESVTDFVSGAIDMVPFNEILADNLSEALPSNGIGLGVTIIFGGTKGAPEVPEDSPLWDALYGDGEGEGEVSVTADATRANFSMDAINERLQLSADLADLASDRAQNYLNRIGDSSNLDDAITAQLNLRDAAAELLDGLTALQGVDIEGFADGTEQVSDDAAAALGDIGSAASAAQEQIANALEFEGEDAARAKAAGLRDEFTEMFRAVGLTEEQITDLLETMGLLPEQVDTAITLSGADEAIAKLNLLRDFYENEDGSSGIPPEITTQVGVAIAEGRFTDAANLISLWVKDQEDGSIEDPLLIAMGLGDTKPASEEVDNFVAEEEAKQPIGLKVDADTSLAESAVDKFRDIVEGLEIFLDVLVPDIDLPWPFGDGDGGRQGGGGGRDKPDYSKPDGDPRTRKPGRAAGGPMLAGAQYEVNERGQELFVSKDGGYMVNASNLKQLMDNLSAVANGGGAGGVVVNQQITTADPVQAGSESARRMRDASYLVGV
jgi:hypothetical protein